MTWFSRLSVFHKIMLILGVYAISSAINFTIGIKGVNDTKSYIVNLEERIYESVQLATQNSFLLQRADEMFTQSVTAGDPEMQTLGEETVGNLLSNIDRLLTIDTSNKDLLSQIKVSAAEYLSVSSKLLNNLLSDNPDFSQLQSLGSQKSDLLSETNALLKQHKANVDIQFSSAIDGALSSSSRTLNMVTVTNVAFLILLSMLIFYIGRLFSNTVNSMKNSLAGLADGSGDLNTRLKVQTEDELGVMTRNFNAFMDRLNEIIRKVKEVAPEVGDAANAMSGSTNHVRSVTENMSTKASEATYAMNEMAKSIEEYLDSIPQNWRPGVEKLRSLFASTELVEELKWGIPNYTLDKKLVAAIAAFNPHRGAIPCFTRLLETCSGMVSGRLATTAQRTFIWRTAATNASVAQTQSSGSHRSLRGKSITSRLRSNLGSSAASNMRVILGQSPQMKVL